MFWYLYANVFFEEIANFLLKFYFPIHRVLFRPKYLYISFDTSKIQYIHQIPNKQEGKIRIVSISDTHERENYFDKNIPDGDIFIHCGDILFQNRSVTQYARKYLEKYNTFLGKLKHKLKIQVAGNHDGILELLPKSEIDSIFSNASYLHDECLSFKSEGGRVLNIYGTPTSGKGISKNGFFQKPFGSPEIMKEWEKIPDGLDILITHGNPRSKRGFGCRSLENVVKLRAPKIHLCGHHHSTYGAEFITSDSGEKILLANSSVLTGLYLPTKMAVVVDY